ncbi:hypothetical protein BH11PLA2_BH11PLA2_17430 [soil metagenome]
MDHVRGSSLVWPATLEALRPFLLTWWSGRTVEDMPADIKAVHDEAKFGGKHVNIALVVLDENGKHLRASVPSVKPGDSRFDPDKMGKDFKRQLDDMLQGLTLPKVVAPGKPKLTLPDLCTEGKPNGVRIYFTAAENRMHHYRTPIVEAVPMTEGIRKALRYPAAETKLTADDLKPWLEQIYPAAMMEGHGGFKSIEGKFTLKPAGQDTTHRYAIAEGNAWFELDDVDATYYRGTLAFVMKYPLKDDTLSSLRGVIDCTVPRGPERIKLTAAIESLPE